MKKLSVVLLGGGIAFVIFWYSVMAWIDSKEIPVVTKFRLGAIAVYDAYQLFPVYDKELKETLKNSQAKRAVT